MTEEKKDKISSFIEDIFVEVLKKDALILEKDKEIARLNAKLLKSMEIVRYVANRKHCKSIVEFIRATVELRKSDPLAFEKHNIELTRIYELAKALQDDGKEKI